MEFALLAPLSEERRRELVSRGRRRRFTKGEVIFHEGDPGDSMHLIAKGHVAVRITTPLGDITTLLVLRSGEHFGEMAVISPGPRNATAIALDPVETLCVHRDLLDELRAEHREVDTVLFDALIAEVRRLSALLAEAMYLPVEKRTWRRLLALTEIYAQDGESHTTIPLTQEDLAGIVGAARPTVNRLLRTAEEQGVLEVGRARIEVLDRPLLERRAR